MKQLSFLVTGIFCIALAFPETGFAQQYKLRQSSSLMGMKTENTIYVKGSRKRTEPGTIMGMAQPVTIEQCDLQRTIKLNDKKKLYFIEPFAKDNEDEVIDDDAPKAKPVTKVPKVTETKTGGTIYMWYSIRDTGERKTMYGMTARHVWTSQKMKPSPDACMMKDSITIRTDGWYIDLPAFNCPVRYHSTQRMQRPNEPVKPDCMDKFSVHRSGKGKLGFPLQETTTIIMGGQGAQMGEMTTSVETIEFSTAKLDSMLFEIPPGYTETKNEQDLQDKMDLSSYKNMIKDAAKNANKTMPVNTESKPAGTIRVGVFQPTGEGGYDAGQQQSNLVNDFQGVKVEAVAVSSEEDARSKKCDYTLTTEFTKFKSGSKVGGLIKAIKNADISGGGNFSIQASFTLKAMGDGSVRTVQNVDGKFEGKPDDAAFKAGQEGAMKVRSVLEN